jgi:hypothetical protein
VRVRRIISLHPDRPVMTTETSYQKVQGAPVRVGIWTITQLASPERAFILLPPHSTLPAGYTNLLPPQPKAAAANQPLSPNDGNRSCR